MQVCTSLQTDNHASTPPLSFLQGGRPSWRPTNSVKALKAQSGSAKWHQNTLVFCDHTNSLLAALFQPFLKRQTTDINWCRDACTCKNCHIFEQVIFQTPKLQQL